MATNAVLEFILGLLRDDEAAANYCANPTAALDAAGLCDVSPADIVAVAPLVAESGLFAGGGADLSAIVNAGASAAGAIGGGLGLGGGLGGGLTGGLGGGLGGNMGVG
ncbi:MAG: IniB N-terminal domain-containing protein, partial [Rhodococcus sp.]|nr:IniB N-terminal domain-containing protein [Rhodococcus sp. (in: high G+C Gram-positive bacteria)]